MHVHLYAFFLGEGPHSFLQILKGSMTHKRLRINTLEQQVLRQGWDNTTKPASKVRKINWRGGGREECNTTGGEEGRLKGPNPETSRQQNSCCNLCSMGLGLFFAKIRCASETESQVEETSWGTERHVSFRPPFCLYC